jgi:hypothetical protein
MGGREAEVEAAFSLVFCLVLEWITAACSRSSSLGK